MRILVAMMAFVAITFSMSTILHAQECRICSRKSTIAACIRCVVQYEGNKYSLDQRTTWCTRNQPACYQPKKKN